MSGEGGAPSTGAPSGGTPGAGASADRAAADKAVGEKAADGKARPGRARLWFWLRLLAVAALLWWVVHKNGRGRIMETLLSADPAWVLLAGAVFFLSILLGAWQWWLLLRFQGIEWGYRASFRTYYSGMFLNNFLPGTVGGDAMRIYEVHKSAEALGKAVAATFLDRLMGFFSLSLMSVIAVGILLWKGTLDQSLFRHLLYAVGVVFGCFVVVLSLLLSRRLSSIAQAIIGWTGMKWLGDAFAKIQDTLKAYHARRRKMAGIILISLAVQALRVIVHWLASLALRRQ
jgi:glycosyltransferase 2 family protein